MRIHACDGKLHRRNAALHRSWKVSAISGRLHLGLYRSRHFDLNWRRWRISRIRRRFRRPTARLRILRRRYRFGRSNGFSKSKHRQRPLFKHQAQPWERKIDDQKWQLVCWNRRILIHSQNSRWWQKSLGKQTAWVCGRSGRRKNVWAWLGQSFRRRRTRLWSFLPDQKRSALGKSRVWNLQGSGSRQISWFVP